MFVTDASMGYLVCLCITLLALITSVAVCWHLHTKLTKRKANPTIRFPMRPYRTFL
jgi:hypothetical protein